jgi:hypothetical protein
MQMAAPYMARFRSSHGIHVQVRVNDVPIYDRAVLDFCAPTYPASPWFVPGENVVEVEVREGPINEDMKTIPPHFDVLFFHQGADLNKDETPLILVQRFIQP